MFDYGTMSKMIVFPTTKASERCDPYKSFAPYVSSSQPWHR
jgi:hypothetical protein